MRDAAALSEPHARAGGGGAGADAARAALEGHLGGVDGSVRPGHAVRAVLRGERHSEPATGLSRVPGLSERPPASEGRRTRGSVTPVPPAGERAISVLPNAAFRRPADALPMAAPLRLPGTAPGFPRAATAPRPRAPARRSRPARPPCLNPALAPRRLAARAAVAPLIGWGDGASRGRCGSLGGVAQEKGAILRAWSCCPVWGGPSVRALVPMAVCRSELICGRWTRRLCRSGFSQDSHRGVERQQQKGSAVSNPGPVGCSSPFSAYLRVCLTALFVVTSPCCSSQLGCAPSFDLSLFPGKRLHQLCRHLLPLRGVSAGTSIRREGGTKNPRPVERGTAALRWGQWSSQAGVCTWKGCFPTWPWFCKWSTRLVGFVQLSSLQGCWWCSTAKKHFDLTPAIYCYWAPNLRVAEHKCSAGCLGVGCSVWSTDR